MRSHQQTTLPLLNFVSSGRYSVAGPVTVQVNYAMTHRAQVEEARFDWFPNHAGKPTLEDPTEHCYPFPRGVIDQQFIVIRSSQPVCTTDILSEMSRRGVRPTLSVEGFAFARTWPQAQLPIVCLASVWVISTDRREVLYQSVDSDGRYFDLRWLNSDWGPYCSFLGVLLDPT